MIMMPAINVWSMTIIIIINLIYYEISIESLENNNGETLEKWLEKYLKENYKDKDKFRINVGPINYIL